MSSYMNRRSFVAAGTGIALAATALAATTGKEVGAKAAKKTGAVEDLMREHGVLRRALLVYHECATRLRTDPTTIPVAAVSRTADLFRRFGEDYHERKLEEAHIFPVVRNLHGAVARYPDVLTAQHARGRQITDYITAVTRGEQIASKNVEPLALALESFVLMYQHHAAREDTVVFTAWKQALSEQALDEMGERFEAIEHSEFGKDGFATAVATISSIEREFGLANIAQFTAPEPPEVG